MARSGDLSLGIVAGAAAGLTAAFVMSEFQSLWGAFDRESQGRGSTPATLKAADKLAEAISGQSVRPEARKAASNTVHYLTGALLGGVYGALAEIFPAVRTGCGAFYGAAAWLVMDEAAVPALALGPSPRETPAKQHLYGLASHVVFGVTLELARAAMADVLEPRGLRYD